MADLPCVLASVDLRYNGFNWRRCTNLFPGVQQFIRNSSSCACGGDDAVEKVCPDARGVIHPGEPTRTSTTCRTSLTARILRHDGMIVR